MPTEATKPRQISREELDRIRQDTLHKALRTGPHTEMHFASDTPVLLKPCDGKVFLQADTFMTPDDAREVAAKLLK